MTIDPATYAAGVSGAFAMSAASAAGRRAGIDVDLELLAGTQAGLAPGWPAWWVGLASQCAIGGLFAHGYQFAFEQLRIRPAPAMGAVLGLIHGAAAGVALAAAPIAHPQIPEVVDPPGAFMLRRGHAEAGVFLGIHVLFGVVVASLLSRTDARRRDAYAPMSVA